MIKDSVKTALRSIWSNKVRSVLTVLGIVIGVASVTILVSLGQGLKNEVSKLIRGFGSNVLIVMGGNLGSGQNMNGMNPANLVNGDIITMSDVQVIKETKDVAEVTPMTLVAGNLKYGDKTSSPMLLGTTPNLTKSFDILKIKYGRMFESSSQGNVIVLGPLVRKELFGDESGIGKIVKAGNFDFEVVGAFDQATGTSLVSNEYDRMSVIPFDTATKINKNLVKINRVVVRAKDDADVKAVKKDLKERILAAHDNEDDFSVLTQDDLIGLFDQFLSLATTLVSAIAAISLVVGGIGIMNIMLVTVTERTKEIGLRKAVGATRLAIAVQFLVESIVITLVGGLIGLGISFMVGAFVAAKTPLKPAITPDVIVIAVSISTIIGIIFGLWPALRAARKDPIEALRYE